MNVTINFYHFYPYSSPSLPAKHLKHHDLWKNQMKYFIFLIKPQFQTLSLIIKAFHIIFIFRFQVIFSPTNMLIFLKNPFFRG